MRKWIVWTAVIAVGLFAVGCGVSKEVVMEKDSEIQTLTGALDECRDARNQYKADLGASEAALNECKAITVAVDDELKGCLIKAELAAEDLANCAKARDEHAAALAVAQAEIDKTRAAAQAAQQEVDAMKDREAQLRSGLEKEIGDKNVEIEQLMGKLTVRVLDEILFDSGSAAIKDEGKAVLEKLGNVLADTTENVRVEGHTDNVPISGKLMDKYPTNWELSGARASSVVTFFETTGVDPTRLEAVGQSFHHPVAENETKEGRQKNRRVEIVLTAAPKR